MDGDVVVGLGVEDFSHLVSEPLRIELYLEMYKPYLRARPFMRRREQRLRGRLPDRCRRHLYSVLRRHHVHCCSLRR